MLQIKTILVVGEMRSISGVRQSTLQSQIDQAANKQLENFGDGVSDVDVKIVDSVTAAGGGSALITIKYDSDRVSTGKSRK